MQGTERIITLQVRRPPENPKGFRRTPGAVMPVKDDLPGYDETALRAMFCAT